MMTACKAAIAFGALLLATAAPAQVIDGEALVEDFVNEVITLQGRFDQRLTDASGELVERSTGTLEIERPGRFRWTYSEPYEQWLVADGVNIWSYDVDLEQVTVKPQVDALANTPALLLGGAEDALEQFDYGGAYERDGTEWVRLAPRDKDSGFERVELGFVGGRLLRMSFFDHLEQTTTVILDAVVVNEPIAAERFEFEVPDDVDLVGTPAVAATP